MADGDQDDLRVTSIVPYRPTSREVVLYVKLQTLRSRQKTNIYEAGTTMQ